MRPSSYLLAGTTLVTALIAIAGCGKPGMAVDPALVSKHQARLTMNDEPDGVLTVLDVRDTLLGVSTDEHSHDHSEHAHENEAEAAPPGDEHSDHAEGEHEHDAHAQQEQEAPAEEAHEHITVEKVEPTGPIDVLMVGTIGGLTNPWQETQPDYPFSKQEASFFLADPGAVAELEVSGHIHAPGEECAFCAAHAADGSAMLAMVRFVDDDGKVLPMGVPDMFDVKALDTVVVRGSARIVAGGMMVVDATGIYIRR